MDSLKAGWVHPEADLTRKWLQTLSAHR